MKKRLLACGLILVMMATAFVGCGSKDELTKEEEEELLAESKTYTFTIWGRDIDQDEERGNWLETRCNMYAAKYPNDEVIFEYVSMTEEEMIEKLQDDKSEAPDIYIFADDRTGALVEDRLLTRLWGDTEEAVESSNITSIADMAKYEDKIYGIPIEANPYVLYYDKSVLSEEDVKDMDTLLDKGVLACPLEDEKYLDIFFGMQDVVEKTETPDLDGLSEEEIEEIKKQLKEEKKAKEENAVEITEADIEQWLRNFKANARVVNDTDLTKGKAGLESGRVQAAIYDGKAYEEMKEILGENLGVAALPTVTIKDTKQQLKCVADTINIGVNPDCDNFEMTIALANYLGSADSQQMHYDMSGVNPISLEVIDMMRTEPLVEVLAQIADRENPGWNEEEEEK